MSGDASTVPEQVRADEHYFTPGRVGLGLFVAAMVAFWTWIFVFAPRENPDRLEEDAFPRRAEQFCAVAQTAIDELPSPRDTPLPADRAAQVEIATDIVEEMVADLQGIADLVTVPGDVALVQRWFEDWDAYVADRRRHVVKLETAGPDASGRDLAFTLSERAAGGIYTRRVDGFANVNEMDSCHVPGDI